MNYHGNQKILTHPKTAFLCSRRCPSQVVLPSLDWAKIMKDKGQCVISGFHSPIEKDVFSILLRGRQPLILLLARGMQTRWPQEIAAAVESRRLLVISPFHKDIKRITQETANKRNEIMLELADKIHLAYASPGGNLDRLIKKIRPNNTQP